MKKVDLSTPLLFDLSTPASSEQARRLARKVARRLRALSPNARAAHEAELRLWRDLLRDRIEDLSALKRELETDLASRRDASAACVAYLRHVHR